MHILLLLKTRFDPSGGLWPRQKEGQGKVKLRDTWNYQICYKIWLRKPILPKLPKREETRGVYNKT